MRINFHNREGNEIWLEQVGENGWSQLRMDPPSLFNYTRLIFEEEDNQGIYAVDPPGGPFISVESKIYNKDLKVKEIRRTSLGIFIRLETLICIDENK